MPQCDEKRPACSDCVRLGKACQQPPSKLAFRTVSFQARDDTSFEDPLPDAVATREPADLSESSAGTPEAQSPLENDWDYAFGEDSTCLSPRMTADARLLPVAAARETGQTVFYSDFWESHCVPAIHPALGELGRHLTRPSFIKEAVLALAACRLSRMTPRRKPFDPKGTPGLSFRPDSGHQAVSCARYGTALTSLGRRINMPSAEDPGTVLAGIILLAHLESLMGNFPQFGLHSMGIERLLSHMRAASVKPDRLTCTLIANWNQIRAQNWWLRLHFSTPDFHCRTERMECSPWLTSVLEEADDSRAIIMSALCECCRLSSLAFLTCRDMDRANVTGPVKAVDPATTTAVDAQHAILDHWHDQLPLSELPIEAFVKAPDTTTEGFEVRPLQFTSHQAAMNYAYYVVSRVFLSVFAAESADEVANSWALLLARIAAGVDWDDCLKLNTFVIGFSSLFVPCALHSSDIRIGLWLQDWIEQRYTIASLEEGSFPVLQVLQPLRVINREHHDGRDVRALFACVEDGGGGAKYSSYNSQHLPSLLVCGQEISTGTCYSRIVTL